ncbi:DUF4232 domain-containing protein [Sphaerisporangium fuscum]|uniref:DUF4232 domain-containing protein n=1 Tax=Sphaerisporangium fuscum TaxID=2835868 RepID=UPI001BDC9CE5|nr:DUF4232 domain-containing protein [Sphaerisporangium fuscum]
MQRFEYVRKPAILLALSAGMLTASVACGGAPPPTGRAAAEVPGPVASSAAVAGSSVTPRGLRAAGVSMTPAAAGRCHSSDLSARVGRQDAGAGQRYAPLVLTNTSARACRLYGYVGLIMIDGKGDVLRTRTRRDGGKAVRVTLRPGASAHAKMHWTVVPVGRETRCPESARLIILPPDEVGTHLEIPFVAGPCDDGRIDVSPMAAGASL